MSESSLRSGLEFVRAKKWLVMAISLALLVPCVWHRRIEAGDLGSHVYNAWLAQLIEKGQAPGLYLSKQWNNVLFDLMLVKMGNWFGLAAAEKIAVYICVLVFFWGAFALVCAVTERVPWFLLPCFGMLAYGWTFSVGFFNYYISLGLGFFAIAMVWRGRGREWIIAALLGLAAWVAHPQGFVWMAGCVAYLTLWRRLEGWLKLLLPIAAAIAIVAVRIYVARHYESYTVWDSFGPGIYGGSDQLALYNARFQVLSNVALVFGLICFATEVARRLRAKESWSGVRLPLELYGVAVVAVYVLPDSVRMPMYAGWIGLAALRLTTVAAVMGLCVMGFVRPRKWFGWGFAAIGMAYFVLLYGATGELNRMEQRVEQLVSELPYGERVAATIWTPGDSRLPFIVHMVDRACVERCFSYGNYEPPSGEFRVRVRGDNPQVTDDADAAEEMESGEYVVRPEDLPMAQIYQCDENDFTKLCVRQLAAGEKNGRLGYHPPKE
ncbi:MAG TPA: hypothetical protein VGI16_11645 [Candidatus Acidoferrum sp.]|jgi:hypothetical protein